MIYEHLHFLCSELARVKDWQAYLDFCRVEVFTNTRLTPIDKTRSKFLYNVYVLLASFPGSP